jgi:hypothetical protein
MSSGYQEWRGVVLLGSNETQGENRHGDKLNLELGSEEGELELELSRWPWRWVDGKEEMALMWLK